MQWIIGDVHGMLRPLETLLEAIHRQDAQAELFFCGDYCDRGPETRGVIDLLLTLKNARLVRGNHDDVLDLALNGQSFATGPEFGGQASREVIRDIQELFLNEGLLETLTSYGADLHELGRRRGDMQAVHAWIEEQLEQVPESHKRFFRELPAVAEADGFFVAHATWPPDHVDARGKMNGAMAGDGYLRHDVLWNRFTASQIHSQKSWERVGYFGHTPTDNYLGNNTLIGDPGQVIRGEKLMLIDTAAFAPGGRLTAVCHDDGRILQAQRSGELLNDL